MRDLAAQLKAIGDQGYALAEKLSRSPKTKPDGSGDLRELERLGRIPLPRSV
jgi:hypothetical protein